MSAEAALILLALVVSCIGGGVMVWLTASLKSAQRGHGHRPPRALPPRYRQPDEAA